MTLKLWSSPDAAFGGDTYRASAVLGRTAQPLSSQRPSRSPWSLNLGLSRWSFPWGGRDGAQDHTLACRSGRTVFWWEGWTWPIRHPTRL